MAKGRQTITRRGHNAGDGKRATSTARNWLPRISSPEGRKARQDARKSAYERMAKSGVPGEYTAPGSSNVRKVGK